MKKTDPGFVVKRSQAGLGLFATKMFTRGERIIEYTGERITADEANKRGGQYLFELNDRWTIDGRGRENTARYINHGCKPNAYAELTADERRVFIFAKRKINPGEEIAYDYGAEFFKTYIKPKGCRCAHCTTLASKSTPLQSE
jgi:SET domain-containing protein